jgi:mRNA-degrading endonuclease RelE of RelBE toxin-antitoxin system
LIVWASAPEARSHLDQPDDRHIVPIFHGVILAFEIKFTLDGLKDVQGLDGGIKRKLKNTLNKKLATNPLSYGTPLRAPLVNYYKHEFATHRIIYRVYDARNIVVICAVGPRKSGDVQDVYAQFNKLAQTGRVAAQIQAVLQNMLKS